MAMKSTAIAAVLCIGTASAFVSTAPLPTWASRAAKFAVRGNGVMVSRLAMRGEVRGEGEVRLDEGSEAGTRRTFFEKMLSSGGAAALLVGSMHSDVASAEDGEVALASTKMYSGPTAYGFTFKYPPSWKPRKKNGNKHLYELEVKAKDGDGAMIGITIDQVKFSKIQDFGTLEEVAAKVFSEHQKQTKGGKVELASKKASTAKNMDYYEISTKSDKFERLVKMASTAEQLFVFTATTPLARSAEFDQAVKESVATFNVRPNYIENFQKYGTNQAPEYLDALKRLPGDFVKVEAGEF